MGRGLLPTSGRQTTAGPSHSNHKLLNAPLQPTGTRNNGGNSSYFTASSTAAGGLLSKFAFIKATAKHQLSDDEEEEEEEQGDSCHDGDGYLGSDPVASSFRNSGIIRSSDETTAHVGPINSTDCGEVRINEDEPKLVLLENDSAKNLLLAPSHEPIHPTDSSSEVEDPVTSTGPSGLPPLSQNHILTNSSRAYDSLEPRVDSDADYLSQSAHSQRLPLTELSDNAIETNAQSQESNSFVCDTLQDSQPFSQSTTLLQSAFSLRQAPATCSTSPPPEAAESSQPTVLTESDSRLSNEAPSQADYEATAKSSVGVVKAIDRDDVHRICSGQVVLSLAIAVKELLENSLDAGATSIEIRLKDRGMDCVEVLDNGSGVHPNNYRGLTLKYHTSKISVFSDLEEVSTFGFRGEALSSLCAVSKLQVSTRMAEQEVGVTLTFDNHGALVSQTPCARETGTTVSFSDLFFTLPVRYKEFKRNIKKEFAKVVQLLQAYCLVCTGIKFTCSSQVEKGPKNMFLATSGNKTIRENIVNVFGPKMIQSMIEFTPRSTTATLPFKVDGLVSKCSHGSGRTANDRQFLSVNKRPCDIPKLSKQINEVYHQYNRHQYPAFVLDITV